MDRLTLRAFAHFTVVENHQSRFKVTSLINVGEASYFLGTLSSC